MFRLIIVLIVLLSELGTIHAQYNDSLRVVREKSRLQKISETEVFQGAVAGGTLLACGLILDDTQNDKMRWLRRNYLPKFRSYVDDYLQYSPAVAMFALKGFGVESRSSWGRMLVADAFTVSLMASSVNLVKYNFTNLRPDQSGENSFPSGHTANAFMTATLLSKEYGHKSPWISAGAYTVATVTGLMRIANDRHWLSDVMAGAGIGILSAEFGYLFSDLIFKEKGLNVKNNNYQFEPLEKPSFLSIFAGNVVPLKGYYLDDEKIFDHSAGTAIGVEGAYFFNKLIGIGNRLSVSTSVAIEEKDGSVEESMYYAVTIAGGAYFNKSINARWLLGSKIVAEYDSYPSLSFNDYIIDKKQGFGFGTGISMTFRIRPHYGLKAFADYNWRPSQSRKCNEYWHSLTCGFAFTLFGSK